jgi:YD repeat-containing protein
MRRRGLFLAVVVFAGGLPLAVNISTARPALASPPTYKSVVLSDNPVGYYRLDETSGTTAHDSSGHAISGTYQSGAYTLGVAGALAGDSDKAVHDSVDSPATAASSSSFPSGNSARTLEVWLRTTSADTANVLTENEFGLEKVGSQLAIRSQGLPIQFAVPYAFADNNWHLFDLTFDGSTADVYYDGALVESAGMSLATSPSPTLNTGGVVGDLDESAIYGAALSPARIVAHWTSGASSRFSCAPTPTSAYAQAVLADHPSAYYRLDDLAADPNSRVMFDSSGNCRNGAYAPGAASAASDLPADGDAATAASGAPGVVGIANDNGLPAGSAARTFEAWFDTSDSADNDPGMWFLSDPGEVLGIQTQDQRLLSRHVLQNYGSFDVPYLFRDGHAHLVDLTFDGAQTSSMYFDGTFLGSTTAVTFNEVAGFLEVGNLIGTMDEAAVYPTALPQSRIDAHWTAGESSRFACAPTPTTGYARSVLADSPAAYYRLDDLSAEPSSRVMFDSSGHCHNGAYSPGAAPAGSALLSDGDGGTATDVTQQLLPAGVASDTGFPTGSSPRTLETWFTTSDPDPYMWFVSDPAEDAGVESENQKLVVQHVLDGHVDFDVPYAFRDGQPHLVDLTFDGVSKTTLYYDGLALGSTTGVPFDTIARYFLAGGLVGSVDEAAVYPTDLSPDRVLAHYLASGHVTFGTLSLLEQLGGGSPSELCVACMMKRLEQFGFPIDDGTGNYFHTFTDFSIPGRNGGLDLTRTYNAQAASTDSPFGFGWSFDYGARAAANGSTVTITEESGSQIVFTSNGSGGYTAPSRVLATLTNRAGGGWTLTRRGNEQLQFDGSGNLVAEVDRNGNTTTLAYSGSQLSTVTDPGGRVLTISWTGSRITSVHDGASPQRTTQYTYNGSGDLTEVADVGGGKTDFAYTNHAMVTMRMPNFAGPSLPAPVGNCTASTGPLNVISNHYDANGRVDCQYDQLGRRTTFAYTLDGSNNITATTVTDPAGHQTVDSFSGGFLTTRVVGATSPVAGTYNFYYDP